MLAKDMKQGKFPYAAGGSTLVPILWKTVWYYLLKLMRHITCELAIALLGIHQNRNACPQAKQQERRMIDHSYLIHNAPKWIIQMSTSNAVDQHGYMTGVYADNSRLYSTGKWISYSHMQQHSKMSQTTLSKESKHMNAYSVIPFILAQKKQAKPK